MKKMGRFISVLLAVSVFLSPILPAYAAGYKVVVITDPNVHEIGNDLLSAFVDDQNGRFLIASRQGKPGIPYDNYSLYLAESGVPYTEDNQVKTASGPESSFTTIKIDGVSYIFGNDYSGQVADSSPPAARKISETVHETVWKVDGVEVTQRLELPADPLDKLAGVVKVSYRVENKSNKEVELGSRILLDTTIGNSDNAVIFIADGSGEREIKTETEIDGEAIPEYWRAQANYSDSINLDAVGVLTTDGIEKPDKMIIGHWKGLSSSKWGYLADPNLDFTVDSNAFGTADSAVALYWENRPLKQGESFTFSTGYGLGLNAVTTGLGKPELFSYPTEVLLTEDEMDYQTFDVRVVLQNAWVREVENVRAGLYFDSEDVFAPVKIVETGSGRVSTANRTIGWDRVPVGESRWATITVKVQKKFKEFTVQDFDIIVMYDDPETGAQNYNLYNCRIGVPAITKVPEVKFTGVGPEYFYFDSLRSFHIQGSGFEYMGERGAIDPVEVKMVNIKDPEDVITVQQTRIDSDNLIWCYLPFTQRFKLGAEYQVTVSTQKFGTYTFPKTLKASSSEKYKNKDYGIVAVYREPGTLVYRMKSFETEKDLLALYDRLYQTFIDDYYNMDDQYAYKKGEEFVPVVIRGSAFGNDETGYRFPSGAVLNQSVIYKTEDLSDQGGIRLTKMTTDTGSYMLLEGKGQLDVAGSTFIDGRFELKLVDGANYSVNYELPTGMDPPADIDYGDGLDLAETYPANPVAIKMKESFREILQYTAGFPVTVKDMMLRRDGVSLSGSMGLFLPANILPDSSAPPGESNKALILRKIIDDRGSLGGGINVYDIRYRNITGPNGQPETKFYGIKTDARVAWPKNLIPLVEFGGDVRVMLDTLEKSAAVSGEVSFSVIRAKGLFKLVLVKMVPVPDSIGLEISGKIPVPLIPPVPVVSIIRGGGFIENFATSVGKGLLDNWRNIGVNDLISATLTVGIADPTGNIISGDPLKLTLTPLGLTARGTLNVIGLTLGEAVYKMNWTARSQNGDTKAHVGASIEGRTSILDVLKGDVQLFAGINEVNVNNPIYPLEIGGKGVLSGSILGVKLANAYAGINNSYVYARGKLLGYDVGIKYYWKTGQVTVASADRSLAGIAGAGLAGPYLVKGNADEGIVIDNFRTLGSSKDRTHLITTASLQGAPENIRLAASADTQHNFVIYKPVDALLKVLYAGETPTITVTAPDGSDYALQEGVNYTTTQDGEQKLAYISLPQAEPGTWQLKADSPVDYELIGVESLPGMNSLEIHKQDGNKISLVYDTENGAGTDLRFYLAEAKDEVGFAVGETSLTANSGTVNLTLPEGLNGGSYYLRAEMLANGANIDEIYAQQQVFVSNPYTPALPAGVTVENAGNNNIRVSWSSEDPLTDGYYIELFDENGQKLTDGVAEVEKDGDNQQTLISAKWEKDGQEAGLAQGQIYKAAVTSFNEVTSEGESESIRYTSQAVFSEAAEFAEANPPALTYSLSNSQGSLEEAEVSGMPGFMSNEPEITVQTNADQNAQVMIYANKEVMAVAPGGSAEQKISLSEGNNELVVKAMNEAGDATEEVMYVLVDTQAPLLMVKSPVQGDVVETDTIRVEGAAEVGSSVTVDGQAVALDADGLFSTEVSFGGLQEKTVRIEAADPAGNSSVYEAQVGRSVDKELMLTYIDSDSETLEIGQPVRLKLYGVFKDNSVLEVDNSSVRWSVEKGNAAATVDEDGQLTVYDDSQVFVKADYQMASDYTLQDVKVFSLGEITHDSIVYVEPPQPGDLKVAAPTANPLPGTYASAQQVTLSSETPGASIYYTTDGSLPTAASSEYTNPISVSASMTIRAVALKGDMQDSEVAELPYVILNQQVAAPQASPPADIYPSAQTVELSTATLGADIYFTTDGSAPTAASEKYTGPIHVRESMTLKAIAFKAGMQTSEAAEFPYTIILQQAAEPQAAPGSGIYPAPLAVALSTATVGADIYYTTDGSMPTTASRKYTDPIDVRERMTLKAIAFKAGMQTSEVARFLYGVYLDAGDAGDVSGFPANPEMKEDTAAQPEFSEVDMIRAIEKSSGSADEVRIEAEAADGRGQISFAAQGIALLAQEEKGLAVQFGNTRVKLPAALLTALDAGDHSVVSISAAETLPPANGGNPDYQAVAGIELALTLAVDGEPQETVSNFTAPAVVTVQLTEAALAGKDTDLLGAYYDNEALDTLEYMGGRYDPATGQYSFETPHWSKYYIMEYKKDFADLPADHWACRDIQVLTAKHVVKGISDSEFAPAAEMTRAQFAALLASALGLKEEPDSVQVFSDVKPGQWFYPVVNAVFHAGLIKGYGNGQFGPDQRITREEMVVMLVRALDYAGQGIALKTAETNDLLSPFHDSSDLSAWSRFEMAAAIKLGIIHGRALDVLAPRGVTSRAEGAVMINQLIDAID